MVEMTKSKMLLVFISESGDYSDFRFFSFCICLPNFCNENIYNFCNIENQHVKHNTRYGGKMVEANDFQFSIIIVHIFSPGSFMKVSQSLAQEEHGYTQARVFPSLSRVAVFISGINLKV